LYTLSMNKADRWDNEITDGGHSLTHALNVCVSQVGTPVAIAPGSVFVVPRSQRVVWRARIVRFVYRRLGPVATTTPAGLPVWGPRSAPGSVFVVSCCRYLC
jgi:hypothetical protein